MDTHEEVILEYGGIEMAKRRKYTEEFKREAVRLVESRGECSVTDVAASLGVAENLLHAWKRMYAPSAGPAGTLDWQAIADSAWCFSRFSTPA